MENKNRIIQFVHCTKCIDELDKSEDEFKCSPRSNARYEVGFTEKGIQVWCITHEINIAHFDLCGNKVAMV